MARKRPAAPGPARHERPAIDEAAMTAARWGDRLLRSAQDQGQQRWIVFLGPIPDRLRDAQLFELREVAVRARAAFGPKDSIRDALPEDLTEPFRDALDRLLRALARSELA